MCMYVCVQTVLGYIGLHAGILLNSKGDTGLPDIFLIDGTEIKDALVIAETFNSYFTNFGPT